MDITLIKTFLEVASTGSFVAAADRLFVTQSAVSLRIQRLENEIGQPLFTRSRAGAEMTSAGSIFENYALSLIKVWEEARQQVGVPEGYIASLTIGGQYSLWQRLGFRWIDEMRLQMPELSIRTELGTPDRLTRFLVEGVVQAALVYSPNIRPGLQTRQILEEKLVLVSAKPFPDLEQLDRDYVFVDWGPEFIHAHAAELPHLTHSGLTFALGALTRDFIINRGMAAYLPARSVQSFIHEGRLHLVPDSPVFPYPAWIIWREDGPPPILAMALEAINKVAILADEYQKALPLEPE